MQRSRRPRYPRKRNRPRRRSAQKQQRIYRYVSELTPIVLRYTLINLERVIEDLIVVLPLVEKPRPQFKKEKHLETSYRQAVPRYILETPKREASHRNVEKIVFKLKARK